MADKKKGKAKSGPKAFSAKKAMAQAFTLGPGAALVQFRRSGPARKGLRAFLSTTNIQWQADDKSVPIPMSSGIHVVGVAVGGSSGSWTIRVVSPSGATGGLNGTLPQDSQGVFNVSVP
ncbi:MAG TPA: hypothetical protein VLE27_17475 [Thermoanaerobaculia bacterium]|nr:hypothetical protein [Thermoanaerobaculia bacterium]